MNKILKIEKNELAYSNQVQVSIEWQAFSSKFVDHSTHFSKVGGLNPSAGTGG
jgi:hypothetical protein